MKKKDQPMTPAIRILKKSRICFSILTYPYVENGGTRHAADFLNVDEHHVIKTLIMEKKEKDPIIVLMHGDKIVSTKALARILSVKRVEPMTPSVASRYTGYLMGGTSPFGTRQPLPVYAEETIFGLDEIFINAGKRGVLLKMLSEDLYKVLSPTLVKVMI